MSEKLNLWQKISQVMKDIEYLQKDDKVSTGGTNSYKAISEEKVTNAVRASLIKNGLVILPIEQQHRRDDTVLRTAKTFNGTTEEKETISRLTTVDTKYKIVDIDTGDFEILASSGTGVDTQDKGVGKAMTYSYKYMLLRTFAIPTGEDPDKISSEMWDEQLNPSKTDLKAPTSGKNNGNANTLPQDKVDAMKVLAKKKGISEAYICKNKNVSKIDDLDLQNWQKVMDWLNTKQDKEVK